MKITHLKKHITASSHATEKGFEKWMIETKGVSKDDVSPAKWEELGTKFFPIYRNECEKKIDRKESVQSSDDFYDWYDDRDQVIKGIAKLFECSRDIASTIYTWYKYESAFEDFESLEEFLDYVADDIYDMIDACDDEDLKQEVLDSVSSSCYIESAVEVEPYSSDDNMMMFYVGPGYPSHKQIREYAKSKGHKYIYWGTDESSRLKGFYNGDTLVTYIDPDELKGGYREDAEKFGEPIEFSQSIKSAVYYPNGNVVPEDSVDMDIYLDYYFGTDRDKDNSHYTDEEKQRSVDYWFKKHEPYDIESAEESEDDLEQVDQEFTSKDTSINSSKLPAIYKLVNSCINCSEEGIRRIVADGGRLYGVSID